VAAISTIATQGRRLAKSLLTGSIWGLGHTATLLVAGTFVILLRVRLPGTLSTVFEMIVGLMLIVLGFWVLRDMKSQKLHFHSHTHDGKVHAHLHSHRASLSHEHVHLPFFVGIIHGLAGSGALIVLVMSTMSDLASGLLFVASFGTGLIVSMSVICGVLTLPWFLGGKIAYVIQTAVRTGAGLFSAALGVIVVLQFFL
jgi:sulfite exporter TauE/SafE